MSQAPYIRRATREDIPAILSMIKELAAFENALDRVEATPESLAATLTFAPCESDPEPPTRYANVFLLIAPDDGTADAASTTNPTTTTTTSTDKNIAGLSLYFHSYSTWLSVPGIYLEDLYVRPAFRRRGYATLLLRNLAKEAAELSGGRGRLEWSCLKWNEGALGFYEKIGALRMEEWVGLRLEGGEVGRFAEGG